MNSKPKIAIIGLKGLPALGGAASSSELVIEELKEYYDFFIYSVDSHTEKKGFWNGYTQIVFKRSKIKYINILIYYIKSVLHCLIFGKYDIIHVNHLSFGLFVPFLKIRYKVIGTDRGLSWMYQTGKGNKWNKYELCFIRISKYFFIKFVDILVTVSSEYLPYYKKYKENVTVINNGIRIQPITTSEKNKKNYLLFSAGRIIELKGCHLFLEALHKLNYSKKVLIIGNINHSQDYKKRIINLAKGLNVEFIDLIKEKTLLSNIINKAKIFIFPSLSEGMSNMLLEVANQKTPLIVSNIPENTSVFSEDEVLFFNSNDVDDLAKKIKYALENYNLMLEKAEKAYQKLASDYNITIISKQYEKQYNKLIGII